MDHNRMYKDFYENQKEIILGKNIKMIKYISVITVIVLLIFLVMSIFFYQNEDRKHAVIIFSVSAVLFVGVFFICKYLIEKQVKNYTIRHIFIWSIMIIYMLLAIYGNTFTIKNGRGVFFPLLLAVIPSLLTLRIKQILWYLITSTALFITVNWIYKTSDIRLIQMYIGLGGFFISTPYNYAIHKLRIRDLYNTYRYQIEAQIDVLTQLPNRRAFYEVSDKVFSDNKHQNIAVFMIDIDALKIINDKSGHQAGDDIILKAAAVLKNYAQHNQFYVARYGGDEFVGFSTNYHIDRIKESLDELYAEIIAANQLIDLNKEIELSVSIGVFYHHGTNKNREQMLADADKALYMAKDKGKNQYVILDDQNI